MTVKSILYIAVQALALVLSNNGSSIGQNKNMLQNAPKATLDIRVNY